MKNLLLRTSAVWMLFCTLLLTGCSVAPWERGNLSKPQMALDPYPTQTLFRGHAYGSREAATGSTAGAGGGCGCY